VKYLRSKNDRAPEENEANFHEDLATQKSPVK